MVGRGNDDRAADLPAAGESHGHVLRAVDKLVIVPASVAHVGLAHRLRDIDVLECAISGRTPKQALRMSVSGSTAAWSAKINGRVEAMFGVSPVSTIDGVGSPWLLLSDAGAGCGKALVAEGRRYTAIMQAMFPTLENEVHANNFAAIRWLRHLGYTVGPVHDRRGHPMREFRKCVCLPQR